MHGASPTVAYNTTCAHRGTSLSVEHRHTPASPLSRLEEPTMGRRHRSSSRPNREGGQHYEYAPPDRYDYPAPHDNYPTRPPNGHRSRQQDDFLPPLPDNYQQPLSDDYLQPLHGDFSPQDYPEAYDYPEGYDYPQGYDYPTQEYDYPPPLPVDDKPLSSEEYNKVKQRNFDVWVQWRKSANESLLAKLNNERARPLPPIEVALQNDRATGQTRTALHHDPNVLMSYSMSTNHVTEMSTESFVLYGIPRAALNLNSTEVGGQFQSEVEGDSDAEDKENTKDVAYTVRMMPVREDDDPTLPRKQQTGRPSTVDGQPGVVKDQCNSVGCIDAEDVDARLCNRFRDLCLCLTQNVFQRKRQDIFTILSETHVDYKCSTYKTFHQQHTF
ncbi:hypothetical protein LSAT2_028772 [Lamellibrachia satsuma]|nr:hypothetical protein LSAT2_028772 [Lamellibrachia satsuma]